MLACAASSQGLGGQGEQTKDSGVREEVEVRRQGATDDPAAFVTVIDASELDRRALDLGGALRRVPGVRVRDYGGLGRYSTVAIRGSTAEQTLVLLDGVPLNQAFGGPVDLSSIPIGNIEEIRVYRGFAPAELGLFGLGGVVDIRTRAPDSQAQQAIGILGGELETRRMVLESENDFGRWGRWRLDYEGFASDGNFRYLDTRGTLSVPEDDQRPQRQNNDIATHTWSLRGGFDDLFGGEVSLGLRSQSRAQGVPGIDSIRSRFARLDDDWTLAQADWRYRGSGVMRTLLVEASDSRSRLIYRDPQSEIGIGAENQQTDLIADEISMTMVLGRGRHRGMLRLGWRGESARVRDFQLPVIDRGRMKRTTWTATFEESFASGRWVVAPSMQVIQKRDRQTFGGGSDERILRNEDYVAGKVGVVYDLRGACELRSSIGHFVRIPTLLDLFGDRGTVVGNPRLVPERGESFEVGTACSRNGAWSVEAVGFARRVRDLILLQANSQSTVVAFNLDRAKIQGLELSLGFAPLKGWRIDATGSLTFTQNAAGGPQNGKPLVGWPEREGRIAVGYESKRWSAEWEIVYVGSNGTDSLNTPERRLPARVWHALNFGADLSRRWRLGIDVQNVFDRETRDVARYPLPGRLIAMHLGWRSR